MSLTLATCNYHAYRSEMGMPVRTSNGFPKYWPHNGVLPHWESTTPDRPFNLPYATFRERYRRKLSAAGVDALREDMHTIYEAGRDDWPSTTLVLLCFENISKKDTWCHRTLFREWWQEQTGEEVRELGPHTPGAGFAPPEPELTLF